MKQPRSSATLQDWLRHLSDAHPPNRIILGLERVRQAAELLDVVPPAVRNIIVAGTNGKGSTSVFIEQLLLAEGLGVGTTLSPHLQRFNERIRIDGVEVEDALICQAFSEIESRCEAIDLTYFERVVLAALWIFRQVDLDVCVLEVGLGGRLDAVNIVDADVSVITSIGLDHIKFLGDDLNSIAREKAGIMRSGVPCILGAADLPIVLDQRASELETPLLKPGMDFRFQRHPAAANGAMQHWSFQYCPESHGSEGSDSDGFAVEGLTIPHIALENAASALSAVCAMGYRPGQTKINQAIARTCLPGRYQSVTTASGCVILDVAHNVAAAEYLARSLSQDADESNSCSKTLAVAGFLTDKDPRGIVAAMKTQIDRWVLVDIPGERGLTASPSAQLVGPVLAPDVPNCGNLEEILTKISAGDFLGYRVVIFGCFRLIESCLNLFKESSHKICL